MKAIVYREFGGPEVFEPADMPEPQAGPGEVRFKVIAIGVNHIDQTMRAGHMQHMFPVDLPAIPGWEAAGVVDQIGEGVTGVSVGDEVIALTKTGAYAEYALADDVAAKPAELDWDSAAAVYVAVETSARVIEELRIADGDTLLIHGAAGVTGSVGVQLAVARGATVIGTASKVNHEFLKSLGAIPVTYGEGLAERVRDLAPQGVDAVYDTVGKDVLDVSIELRGGTTNRIVTIADLQAFEKGVTFSKSDLRKFGPQVGEFARAVADGKLHIRIDRSLPLADASQAAERIESGHAQGKVILRP